MILMQLQISRINKWKLQRYVSYGLAGISIAVLNFLFAWSSGILYRIFGTYFFEFSFPYHQAIDSMALVLLLILFFSLIVIFEKLKWLDRVLVSIGITSLIFSILPLEIHLFDSVYDDLYFSQLVSDISKFVLSLTNINMLYICLAIATSCFAILFVKNKVKFI